ncbi:hypothetical protein [Candidatus Laterigemmans baculatus]|uniref:hypothetical protein n=1 Tax=Candidatus Laterigemmans baculatus TaxID=2770505 RepID=UPI0013DAC00E|nr:hypothetical protein [Candidatus Laterigemmans baculatus]
MIWRVLTGFCVATVLTQMLVLGVLAARGALNSESGLKIVALANGIDISGDQLRTLLEESQTVETPSFEEVLEKRAQLSFDSDVRLQSQMSFHQELQRMLRELQEKEQRFDIRREAFNKKLAELEQGARDEGMQEVQRTLEVLDPAQAKAQLVMMYDDGEIDTVVNIVQAMPADKRKKILGEFAGPDETEKLYEVLRRLGEGDPKQSLIEQARQDPEGQPTG